MLEAARRELEARLAEKREYIRAAIRHGARIEPGPHGVEFQTVTRSPAYVPEKIISRMVIT